MLKVFLVSMSAFLIGVVGNNYLNKIREVKHVEQRERSIGSVKQVVTDHLVNNDEFPGTIIVDGKAYNVAYTFDEGMMNYAKDLLMRYKSDYATITVIDNNTGNILASVGYDKNLDKDVKYLPFSSTHPAASLMKIITSAGLLKNSQVDAGSMFRYLGRGTTLYKYQLDNPNSNLRWARKQTLSEAFASSNNVIFGKAAIMNLTPEQISEMAVNFGFNKELMTDIDIGRSQFKLPTNDYGLAELASGFNIDTLISPLHAAILPSVVANDGVLVHPKLISKVVEAETGKMVEWKNLDNQVVLSHPIARNLMDMMEMTVINGTARKSFRGISKQIKNKMRIGGKTGSITGGIPFGKRDWFVAYAVPKDRSLGKGISISVMNINLKKWHVRSTYLAKEIIEYYFENYMNDKNVYAFGKHGKFKQGV